MTSTKVISVVTMFTYSIFSSGYSDRFLFLLFTCDLLPCPAPVLAPSPLLVAVPFPHYSNTFP
jgi:hypothetical protein